MATKTKPTEEKETTETYTSDSSKIADYAAEYNRYLNILGAYHTNRFDVNYRQYTAYSDTRGTSTRISDPVAPELTERMVQSVFQRPPKFYAMARGHNLPKEISSIIEGTAQFLWTDPKVVQKTGSMREKLKVAGREFGVTGNTGTETFYNAEADAPDFRVIPVEDIIFDPTKTLKRSSVYYVRQYVSLKYLQDHEEIDENGQVIKGRFKNLKALGDALGQTNATAAIQQEPISNIVTRSGQQVAQRPVDQILLVSRWEGEHCCRVANWSTIIEEFDNEILDDDPLDFAMDIEVPKQPYAYGLLDFLNGLTHFKDMMFNQMADYGSKALNPPLYVDPSIAANPANRQSLRNAYKLGGIVMANPQQVGHLAMPALPQMGFEFLTYTQQRAESVTGLGNFLNSSMNSGASGGKLNKTATEIAAQVSQTSSPIRDRQINIEESLIEPITNKMLKYKAALMGKDEIAEVFITGQSPKWVKVTKNLLQGKITLPDLVIAGLVSNVPTPDPETQQPPVDAQGQPLKNPKTGYYIGSDADQLATDLQTTKKNPNKEVLFDVDWVVRVETGSMADEDSGKDVQNLSDWVNFRLQFRIPTDLRKVSEEMGLRMGIKDPSQYDMDPENTPPGVKPEMNASTLPFIFPKESINFGDMPPDGKIQMAQNAGIQLNPQDLMATGGDQSGRYPPAHSAADYASALPPQQNPMNPNGAMQQNPSGPPGQAIGQPPAMNPMMQGPQGMPPAGPGPGMAQGEPKSLPNSQPQKLQPISKQINNSAKSGMPSQIGAPGGNMPVVPGASKRKR